MDEDGIEEQLLIDTHGQSSKWIMLEKSRGKRHWLPWRPNIEAGEADEDCEDPDRLILLDDISTCLFTLEIKAQHFVLVLAFLNFLGVDLCECSYLLRGVGNGLLETTDTVNLLSKLETFNSLLGEKDKMKNIDIFVDNLFGQLFSRFDGLMRTSLTRLLVSYKLKTCQSVIAHESDKKVSKAHIKQFKNFTKNLLKEEGNRNDLLLWEAYAVSEYLFGGTKEAKRILEMAVKMSGGTAETTEDPLLRCLISKLYSTRLDMEMGTVQGLDVPLQFKQTGRDVSKESLMSILCTACDGDYGEVSPSRLLRCRNKIQQIHEKLLDEYDKDIKKADFHENLSLCVAGHIVAHWTKCYATFQYYTVGQEASSVIYVETLRKLKPFSPFTLNQNTSKSQWKLYELCTANYLSLLRFHVETHVSPLGILRIPLQQALSVMPENEELLTLYTSLESKSSIAGRLRRYFHKTCANATRLYTWFCILSAEISRLESLEAQQQGITGMVSYNFNYV